MHTLDLDAHDLRYFWLVAAALTGGAALFATSALNVLGCASVIVFCGLAASHRARYRSWGLTLPVPRRYGRQIRYVALPVSFRIIGGVCQPGGIDRPLRLQATPTAVNAAAYESVTPCSSHDGERAQRGRHSGRTHPTGVHAARPTFSPRWTRGG